MRDIASFGTTVMVRANGAHLFSEEGWWAMRLFRILAVAVILAGGLSNVERPVMAGDCTTDEECRAPAQDWCRNNAGQSGCTVNTFSCHTGNAGQCFWNCTCPGSGGGGGGDDMCRSEGCSGDCPEMCF